MVWNRITEDSEHDDPQRFFCDIPRPTAPGCWSSVSAAAHGILNNALADWLTRPWRRHTDARSLEESPIPLRALGTMLPRALKPGGDAEIDAWPPTGLDALRALVANQDC